MNGQGSPLGRMTTPTIIMAAIAVIMVLVGYFRGEGEHASGLRSALETTWQTLPLLILAFIVGGMAEALLPREAMAEWIGEESGVRGILIGSVAGGLVPGGPYVSFPVGAILLRSGASVGTMVAFISGWAIYGVSRLPMEVGILGWKLTLIRLGITLLFPPIAGLLAQLLFGGTL